MKTDIEISKALALAIGWPEVYGWMTDECKVKVGKEWVDFDYRDWNVIGPIAAKYDCFPQLLQYVLGDDKWCAKPKIGGGMDWMANTPQKAIALAVIGAKNE